MKSLKFLITLGILAFSTNGSAASIQGGIFDGTDVGNVDGLIIQESITSNSNPTTETAWANQFISGNAEYIIKTEDITYYNTTLTDVFAFELTGADSDYFIIKNSRERALFRNGDCFDWGVFDASLFEDGINVGGAYDFTISHVTEINGPGRTVVPIPAAVWLFGTGLVGLVAVAQRRKRA